MSTSSSAAQESLSLILTDDSMFMNIILRYISAVGLAFCLLTSCNGGKDAIMGPEDTVEAFCRAVAAGDMEAARSLCDGESMKEYLDGWVKIRGELALKDSSALNIAAGILSEADFLAVRSERRGNERFITYTLEADGKTKTRQAIVINEEGEWRVKNITDVQ